MTVTRDRSRAAADSVIPLPGEDQSPPLTWLRHGSAVLAAVLFLLVIPAGWARLDHLWAEDGARFMVDAVRQPALTNLVEPYGGYLHTLPRLVAELVALFPLEWTAAGFAVCAAVLRALIALITFAASGAYLRSTPLRLALAALVVVLPAGNSETINNMANLHWFLLYGAFWALLWRRAPQVPVALFLFLAAVSSPFVLLLAPIALARLVLPHRAVPITFLVGLLVQSAAMLFASRTPYSNDTVDPVQVLLASLLRVPVVALLGSEQVSEFYPAHGNLVILGAVLLVAVPIAAALWRGNQADRSLAVIAAAYSVIVIVATLVMNWTQILQVQQPGVVMIGQRYSVAPCLFLFTAVMVGLDVVLARRWERLVVGASAIAVGIAVVASVVAHIRHPDPVLRGVPWDESVARARAECAAGAQETRLVHEPTDWFFVLPCRAVG